MEENKLNAEEANKEVSSYSGLEEFEEAIEAAPEEVRHEIKRMIGMSMQMGGVVSPQMELMKKMQPEHVTEFLAGQREAAGNQFKESRERKIFLAFSLVVILIFVTVMVVILKDKSDLLEKVLYTLGGLITGLIGGYGYGKSRGE